MPKDLDLVGVTARKEKMMADHEHRAEYEDGDECVECEELFCPDTRTTVDIGQNHSTYWHRDDTTCFLHPLTHAQLVAAGYRLDD